MRKTCYEEPFCRVESILKEKLESLVVFGIMAGVLLPARLLFVEFVSDDWLGSVGIISAISLAIVILAKKEKLGFFGPMFERQLYKFQNGKRGIIVFVESTFLLFILGSMIFAIEMGNTVYSDYKTNNIKNISIPQTEEQMIHQVKELKAEEWFIGFIMIPAAFVTEFPLMSATMASIDETVDGWLMHFYTVGFIEYVELLGILMFYKISFRKKMTVPVASTL